MLFDVLCWYFCDLCYGGWIYSVDVQGVLFDMIKDFYMYVFIVFVCVVWYVVLGDVVVCMVVEVIVVLIQDCFVLCFGDVLFDVVCYVDFLLFGSGVLQNLLMYLIEVWFVVVDVFGDIVFDDVFVCIVQVVECMFVDVVIGCVVELLFGVVDNCFEFGYQFEWFYLVDVVGVWFVWIGLFVVLLCVFVFVEQYGVDLWMGGVCVVFDVYGVCIDGM